MKNIFKVFSFVLCTILLTQSCDTTLNNDNNKTEIEQKFDSVNVYTKDGKTMQFSKFIDSIKTNKPIVVVTTYDYCGACKTTIEDLIKEKEKTQKFEVVAFFIEAISPKSSYIKNENRFKKFVEKYNYNCPTIFDPTGSYTNYVLNGKGGTPQTNIFLNDSIVFYTGASEYVHYFNQSQLIIDALNSQDKPISNTINYSNDTLQLSYSIHNFKKIGEWKRYHKNGELRTIGNYLNDNKEGEWKNYYNNGQLNYIGKFTNDKPEREHKRYYENGQVANIYNYINGKKEGEWKTFYENGQLKELRTYKNDEPIGEYKDYFDNGQLKRIFNYIEGKASGEFKAYYNDGKISTVSNYQNDKSEGESKHYFKNGQLSSIGNYKNNLKNGEWKNYFDNGQLSSTGSYKEGERDGEWKSYFTSGQIVDIGKYSNGKPNGEWNIYWSNGQLYQLRNWKDGKLIDIYSSFDENGNTINKGTLANGNGTRNHHNKKGKITSTDNYINGEKEEGYHERIANEKLYNKLSNTKTKKLKPETDIQKYVQTSYSIKRYATTYDDEDMVVSIPFDVPKQGEINFLIYDNKNIYLDIDVISDNLEDQLISANYQLQSFKLYKEYTEYIDGKKYINKENGKYFGFKTLGSNDLDMENLRGKTAYILFKISKKSYAKNKNKKFYIGYYTLKNLQEIETFNLSLKALDKSENK